MQSSPISSVNKEKKNRNPMTIEKSVIASGVERMSLTCYAYTRKRAACQGALGLCDSIIPWSAFSNSSGDWKLVIRTCYTILYTARPSTRGLNENVCVGCANITQFLIRVLYGGSRECLNSSSRNTRNSDGF